MKYVKPRPMDPRHPENAEKILAERLAQALGESNQKMKQDAPVVFGFFR